MINQTDGYWSFDSDNDDSDDNNERIMIFNEFLNRQQNNELNADDDDDNDEDDDEDDDLSFLFNDVTENDNQTQSTYYYTHNNIDDEQYYECIESNFIDLNVDNEKLTQKSSKYIEKYRINNMKRKEARKKYLDNCKKISGDNHNGFNNPSTSRYDNNYTIISSDIKSSIKPITKSEKELIIEDIEKLCMGMSYAYCDPRNFSINELKEWKAELNVDKYNKENGIEPKIDFSKLPPI